GLGRVRQPVGPRPVGSDIGGLGAATGVFLVVHRRGAGPGAGPPEAVRVATSRTDRGHWCRAGSGRPAVRGVPRNPLFGPTPYPHEPAQDRGKCAPACDRLLHSSTWSPSSGPVTRVFLSYIERNSSFERRAEIQEEANVSLLATSTTRRRLFASLEKPEIALIICRAASG